MISERVHPGRSLPVERNVTISIGQYRDRIGIAAILLLAAILDFYSLGREGYGNTYYAAAIKSMMQSWHNFFFNAFDPGGFVTIDKPPLGFWLQVVSAKIFGFNGVALMLPQALAGVLSVGLLYYLVARIFGKPAGLLAALALAITPISVVANRNNIVDSTLVLAVLLGAWAVSRAVETGKLHWLLLCALFVGLGFNVKMLQAYLVLPAFGAMYLLGARIGWGRRVAYLLLAGIALLTVSLSWVVAVDATSAAQRPYVGSTTNNSELSLAIGYNGLQRLTGNSSVGNRSGGNGPAGSAAARGSTRGNPGPGAGGGPGGAGENGPTGPLRLLDSQLGSQIGWLLPLAAIGLLVAAFRNRRWPLDTRGAALVLWGMWVLTMDVFFNIAGFYHTYYLVMIAPGIAALSGIGIVSLWQMYRQHGSRLWVLLPLSLLAVAAVETRILSNYPAWSSWLSPLVLGLALLAALILTFLRLWSGFQPLSRALSAGARAGAAGADPYGSGNGSVTPETTLRVRVMIPAVLLGVAALLLAPAIWSVETVQAADSGITPRAGPAGTTNGGFGGAFGGAPGGIGRFRLPSGSNPPLGGPPPGTPSSSTNGSRAFGAPNGSGSFAPPAGFRLGGRGPGGNDTANASLVRYLEQHQGSAKYLVATTNAGTAEPYIIATGKPVMALGGFTGSDPILTTAKLAALVRQGAIRYFLIDGGGFSGPGGGSDSLTTWIQQHARLITVAGTQLYEYTGSR